MKSLGWKDGLEQIEVSREEIEKWESKAEELRKKAFIQYELGNDHEGCRLVGEATRYEVSVELAKGNRLELAIAKKKQFIVNDKK